MVTAPDFNNLSIAFANQSNRELRRAFRLFSLLKNPWLVRTGKVLLNIALAIHFPVKWIIKPTIFNHFCGGETTSECDKVISNLAKSGINTILDYSVEGNNSESSFDYGCKEILQNIEKAKSNKNLSFSVFKMTGIARFELLEKISSEKELSNAEKAESERIISRVDQLCKASFLADVPIFIDAEETWIQKAIDMIAAQMTEKYNCEKAIVHNTLQMYRTDRIAYLKDILNEACAKNYFPGFKLVRGAYLEKERERSQKMNYPSPVFEKKEQTDDSYNKALEICFENKNASVCAATHNETSSKLLAGLLIDNNINASDKRYCFAQLFGMSDHISYNLASCGFNTSKYLPYGPVYKVMPYLIRRAEENTSVAGQTGREFSLLKQELNNRKHITS
jgi:proline dehydrogenase